VLLLPFGVRLLQDWRHVALLFIRVRVLLSLFFFLLFLVVLREVLPGRFLLLGFLDRSCFFFFVFAFDTFTLTE